MTMMKAVMAAARRNAVRRLVAAGLAGAALVAGVAPGAAEFFGWQVANVAAWDVLNVRAYPSSQSTILVGYPNGTPISLTGQCTDGLNLNQLGGLPDWQKAQAVRYRWCETWVDPLGNGQFRSGWVYGRYLRPL